MFQHARVDVNINIAHARSFHQTVRAVVAAARTAVVVVVVVDTFDVDVVVVELSWCRRTVATPTRALDISQLMAPLTCCELRLSNDALLSTKDILSVSCVCRLCVVQRASVAHSLTRSVRGWRRWGGALWVDSVYVFVCWLCWEDVVVECIHSMYMCDIDV